jgi:hypothetical protein
MQVDASGVWGLNHPKYPILSIHHDRITFNYGAYKLPVRTSFITLV